MSNKKTATLSSSLVAVKGEAKAPSHEPEITVAKTTGAPLNFKVDTDFRRRFRQRAAEADLKLNQLLREALDAWEEKRGFK
jgi:hypothetical protein